MGWLLRIRKIRTLRCHLHLRSEAEDGSRARYAAVGITVTLLAARSTLFHKSTLNNCLLKAQRPLTPVRYQQWKPIQHSHCQVTTAINRNFAPFYVPTSSWHLEICETLTEDRLVQLEHISTCVYTRIRADWSQGMLAIIRCRTFCLPVCFLKI